ncbi:hypothetical protein AB0F13_00825 [Streptomyces sp. NPDC026206]|uniref:hypothetical protein n=1 Tax=Streptomyces sp. NPDC026206 TaxID=3157089 RepID=UPI0033E5C97F
MTPISRRTILARAVAISAAAASSYLLSSPAQAAGVDPSQLRSALDEMKSRNDHVLTGKLSVNGWEMEKVADNRGNIYTRPTPGVPLDGVAVRMGDVETVLIHLVRRFHYEVDELRKGDVIGWRSPITVQKRLPESNQASGTAVQIRPGHYPAGAQGGFFPQQQIAIRDILAELDGIVRWGGDDRKVNEALFYIDVKPSDGRLSKVAGRIRGWKDEPGQGAGAPVDLMSRMRRESAMAMESRQRQAA